MIVVTGAAGFIGSCLVERLMALGHEHNIVLVDDFSKKNKEANLINKSHLLKIERDQFISWLGFNGFDVEMVFHMGARTDTTEQDVALFDKLNLNYSKSLFQLCCDFAIPFVYASSAATYGLGEFGFDDDESKIPLLQPLNPYGWSKQNFDIWVLAQDKKPPFWAGLKFFNVYGPNEYHKARMASVIFHTFNKIKENGSMQLFKSHRPDFADGQQSRDFIYVKDVVNIISHFIHFEQIKSGIFNVGTGKARSFYDLADCVFQSLGLPTNISFIDTPLDIRENYQYFTEANIDKLYASGYQQEFFSLEAGINDYVTEYLKETLYI
ncbi:MAG: ADP-glyceromanno-heptose 6-epimerase [Saprospiraceae bacterium]